MKNVLVLCTGNSARSILGEALLNRLGEGRVRAFSAGSQPKGAVHPQALELLRERGFDTSWARSKSWDEFACADAPAMDMVITVCGSAAAESCPVWPGAPVRAHWGVADPAAVEGREQRQAFEITFARLEARVNALMAGEFEAMDNEELARTLAAIGAGEAEQDR